MICKKCNFENADDARFCASCGANLSEQAEAVEEVTEEMVEDLQQSSDGVLSEDELNQMILTEEEQLEKLEQEKRIPVNYIPFDYRI